MDDNIFDFFKKILIYLIPLVAFLGAIIPIFFQRYSLLVVGSYLTVPMILSIIVYLIINKNKLSIINIHKISKTYYIVFFVFMYTISVFLLYYHRINSLIFNLLIVIELLILYFEILKIELSNSYNFLSEIELNNKNYFITQYVIIYILSLFLLYYLDVRTYSYYFLISIEVGLIFAEIILFENNYDEMKHIIMAQIILLFLNIMYGVNLKYPYFFGRTDVFPHVYYINYLLEYGSVSSVFGFYEFYPYWHIFMSIIVNIAGKFLPTHKIVFLVNGLLFSVFIILMYLITYKIFNNIKISLISSLISIIFPDLIIQSTYAIPRSIISIFLLYIIYLLLNEKDFKSQILSYFYSVIVSIYHTSSTLFIIPIFSFMLFIDYVFYRRNENRFVSIQYIFSMVFFTVLYWIVYATPVYNMIIRDFMSIMDINITATSINTTPIKDFYNFIQYSFYILLIIIGSLISFDKKNMNKVDKIFSLVGLLSIIVTFPGPLLLVSQLLQNFNLTRFGHYTFYFLVMCSSIGIIQVTNKLKNRYKVISLLFIILMSFFSISNDFTSSDNPLVKRAFYNFYLEDSELRSSNFLKGSHMGYVFSDHAFNRYLGNSLEEYNNEILQVRAIDNKILTNSSNDILVIRESELDERSIMVYLSNDILFYPDPTLSDSTIYVNKTTIKSNLIMHNILYSTKTISLYKR